MPSDVITGCGVSQVAQTVFIPGSVTYAFSGSFAQPTLLGEHVAFLNGLVSPQAQDLNTSTTAIAYVLPDGSVVCTPNPTVTFQPGQSVTVQTWYVAAVLSNAAPTLSNNVIKRWALTIPPDSGTTTFKLSGPHVAMCPQAGLSFFLLGEAGNPPNTDCTKS